MTPRNAGPLSCVASRSGGAPAGNAHADRLADGERCPTSRASLISLGTGSAIVPVQFVITMLLLRSSGGRARRRPRVGRRHAVRGAWRRASCSVSCLRAGEGGQLRRGRTRHRAVSCSCWCIAPPVLCRAPRNICSTHPDEDALPPKWMAMVDGVSPVKAFPLGVGAGGGRRQVLGLHPRAPSRPSGTAGLGPSRLRRRLPALRRAGASRCILVDPRASPSPYRLAPAATLDRIAGLPRAVQPADPGHRAGGWFSAPGSWSRRSSGLGIL